MEYCEKEKIINSLDNFLNGEYQDDIILYLKNNYKDDKWSIMCAVMHWMNTVKYYTDCKNILKKDTEDYNWGNVYLYISAVDIITKGIHDLNKIVTKKDEKLFKGENDIFGIEGYDDNQHFQNIRAIFGAHSTNLKGNGNYIVSTFPTPYNWKFDEIRGTSNNWDYYTLLWSKEKGKFLDQKEFGFSFKSIDMYLDKHLLYLEEIYKILLCKIKKYKLSKSKILIENHDDPIIQLKILQAEDMKRLDGKYSYIIESLIELINVKIEDKKNEEIYNKYRKRLIRSITKIKYALQYPNRKNNIDEVEQLICPNHTGNNEYSYYYSKIIEYKNNIDFKIPLINYFKDKISPFNSNVSELGEMYCLVKASNFLKEKNPLNKD